MSNNDLNPLTPQKPKTKKCDSYLNDYGIGSNRVIKTNFYLNNYNYYVKNNIKMKEIRRKINEEQFETAKKSIEAMPKLLYSNKFIPRQQRKFFSYNNSQKIITKPKNLKLSKNKLITNAIKEEKNSKKVTHIKKHLQIFEDLFNCIDNLDLDESKDLEENNNNYLSHERNENNKMNKNHYYTYDVNVFKRNKTLELNKDKELFEEENDEPINKINVNINNDGGNNNNSNKCYHQRSLSEVTSVNDDTIVDIIQSDIRKYKDPLKFNKFYKFKYTQKGIEYPNEYKKDILPEYQGNDGDEKQFYNYKKNISNPKHIYNKIGSFSEKFNKELKKISKTYGKTESKGRFIENPILGKCEKFINNYKQYKNIKVIENRYIDINKYRYKLLPLINSKKSYFDKLGQKIFYMINNKNF